MVPISRMNPRSFITNVKAGDTLRVGAPTLVRGIAFGGDTGVARVRKKSAAAQVSFEARTVRQAFLDARGKRRQ